MENVDKIKRGEPVKDPDKIVKATMGGVALALVRERGRASRRTAGHSLLAPAMHAATRLPPPPNRGAGWQRNHMRTDLFDFDLPPDRIALRPASPREAAKLLVVQPGERHAQDRTSRDLPRSAAAGRLPGGQRHQGDSRRG